MRIADRPLATLCALLAALAGLLVASGPADAAARLVIKGRGWGHGIGMSQYGAKGFADRGADYKRILGHYYAGTRVLPLGESPTIRVLLQSGRRAVFSGAVAAGSRRLNPASTYQATRSGARVALLSAKGRRIGTYDAPLRIAGPDGGAFRLHGLAANGVRDGRYRGALEIRPGGSGVLAINALDLESYIRGVVSAESPASWPAEALKAQAVAARSYAVTTRAVSAGAGFDHYPDQRSQVYRGVAAEYPSTDAAVQATRGEVVAFQGRPVTTFFFSTSGGKTEHNENVFLGGTPRAWLRGVDDPYDSISPHHKWGPITLSATTAARKLGGLVRGSFRGIKVTRRGWSPRVVRAEVLGSRGRTQTTGPILRARLGLKDTWASFTYISSNGKTVSSTAPEEDAPKAGSGTGGVIAGASARRARGVVSGRIVGDGVRRTVTLQRRVEGRWRAVGRVRVARDGRYSAAVARPGVYRVAWGDIAGPATRVR